MKIKLLALLFLISRVALAQIAPCGFDQIRDSNPSQWQKEEQVNKLLYYNVKNL